ncbi:MAG: hypothetical protein GXP30_08330 [Verrucomicrobia bacterium]|nr:hypothetical protein [Verrucomicrobiota bacterium]
MNLFVTCGIIGVALVFQSCVISGNGAGAVESRYRRLADEYDSKNPVREAERDFKKGSYEIYSAKSFSLYYPGLDIEVGEAVAKKHGVKHISGTSDEIESDAHREFNLAAFHFAMQYNQRKMQLLRDSGKLRGE